eukprot:TRINITY_DN5433_c0_g1_i4.p1 TRINITY_DN5433_c0_g1~~TRINITY_DN5433_c0_g1_i4.p1  ORF type:complete len:744 (-),score=127.87 TRINITY_DN5433_c0_g1_i4:340-2571(-)
MEQTVRESCWPRGYDAGRCCVEQPCGAWACRAHAGFSFADCCEPLMGYRWTGEPVCSDEHLHRIQVVLRAWDSLDLAVADHRFGSLVPGNWASLMGPLYHLVWRFGQHDSVPPAMIKQNCSCATALIAARLLLFPWRYSSGRRLSHWLGLWWLLRYNPWDLLVVNGWSLFFKVLQFARPFGRNVTLHIGGDRQALEVFQKTVAMLSALRGASCEILNILRTSQAMYVTWARDFCGRGCKITSHFRTTTQMKLWSRIAAATVADATQDLDSALEPWRWSALAQKRLKPSAAAACSKSDTALWQTVHYHQAAAKHASLDVIESLPLMSTRRGLRCSASAPQPSLAGSTEVAVACEAWRAADAARGNATYTPVIVDAPLESAKVAVCVTGPLRTANLTAGLESIRDNLAAALEADLFLYIPVPQDMDAVEEDHSTEYDIENQTLKGESATPGSVLRTLQNVRTAVFVPEWTLAELASLIHAGTPGGNARLAKFLRVHGNWRAPLFGEIGGNLLMLYQQHQCRRMVIASEAARSRKYHWVVWSRIDSFWLFPHPPLQRLPDDGRRVAWVPDGEDWGGGLNDRHAAVQRSASDAYLSRWETAVDGSVLNYVREARRLRKKLSGETWLRIWIQRQGLTLARFAPTSVVQCCQEGPGCSHEFGAMRPKSSQVIHKIVCAKYFVEEYSVAAILTDERQMGLRRPLLRSPSDWSWIHSEKEQRWDLHCGLNPSGAVTSWSWLLRRRCQSVAS